MYRQSFSQRLSHQVSIQDSPADPDTFRNTEQNYTKEYDQHEKMMELHSTIYNLRMQNLGLEEQAQKNMFKGSVIKVEDGYEGMDPSDLKRLNQDSSSSKRYSESQGMSPGISHTDPS